MTKLIGRCAACWGLNCIGLEERIDALIGKVDSLNKEVSSLKRENARLRKKVATLESKMGKKNSSNSSMPPSKDENRVKPIQSITNHFADGLPDTILVSDYWAAQLKTPSLLKQLRLAHIQRELR